MPDKKDRDAVKPVNEAEPLPKHDHTLLIVSVGLALVVVLFVGIGLGAWGRNQRAVMRSVSIAGGFPGPKVVSSYVGGAGVGPVVNSADSVSGTVTTLNGSSFTVAGYGSSTNVQTDSSTQYRYGDSVKVDDTVVVYGTTNNGTLSASLVSINP
jgi:hypothetical protein